MLDFPSDDDKEISMNKKKKNQVVIMVAAVFLCGIAYIVLGGRGVFGADRTEETGEIEFQAGKDTVKTQKPAKEDDASAGDPDPESRAAPSEVFIYVCGAVKHPGVFTFDHNPRLVEAVEAAGGFTKKADRASVNLASMLEDGAQVVIYEEGVAGTGTSPDSDSGPPATGDGDRIDINTAGHTELMKIPGIGDAKASAIESYRSEHGRFSKPEDVMQISGIKQGIFDRMKDFIKV